MIVSLKPDNLSHIWLVSETHYTSRLLRQHLERYPHLGWMVQESGDYIVGNYWKDRPDIGQIMECTVSPHRIDLVTRLLESFRETGSELVILSEREVTHGLRLYLDSGFGPLEHVVCYDKPDSHVPRLERRLHVHRLKDSDIPALLKLEQATFPWLWWETATTFQQADQRPDTWILVAYLGDELIGYLILTVRGTWGHLNRIGVRPDRQGQGFGRELLAIAVEEMAGHGARTFGLNTQSDNTRSQHLYESFGFERTGETFEIYGKWLDGRR